MRRGEGEEKGEEGKKKRKGREGKRRGSETYAMCSSNSLCILLPLPLEGRVQRGKREER
jgi:hypothetical protein